MPAIRVDSLSKKYHIGVTHARSLNELASRLARRLRGASAVEPPVDTTHDRVISHGAFWALKDVSFEVQPGEVVGIIGRNGAGKSTLLKILSRVTKPTTGRVELSGRVASLLEVGTGFHPELTGRENVYMNGTLLGMSKTEVRRCFDDIVAFAGVERFIDTPVKRYSSGMKVRLGFAVAAHLEPEILIVDEVLAVGDADFQRKCLGKMEDVAHSGRTVLFVSHSMPAVRRLTSRALFLRSGTLIGTGPTNRIIDQYLNDAARHSGQDTSADLDYFRRDKASNAPARFTRIWINDGSEHQPTLQSGSDLIIYVDVHSDTTITSACVSLTLMKDSSDRVTTIYSRDSSYPIDIHPGMQTIACRIHALPLAPGRYTVSAGLNRNANTRALDVLFDVPLFDISMPARDSGAIDWPNRPWGAVHWESVTWQISPKAELQ